jgi:hypothetical protein
MNPEMPPPAGALEVHEWHSGARYFTGQQATIAHLDGSGNTLILIGGLQRENGQIERFVTVDGMALFPCVARELAVSLYRLAAHAEEMSEYDPRPEGPEPVNRYAP